MKDGPDIAHYVSRVCGLIGALIVVGASLGFVITLVALVAWVVS